MKVGKANKMMHRQFKFNAWSQIAVANQLFPRLSGGQQTEILQKENW